MLIALTEPQVPAVLGALRRVATAAGARTLSPADVQSLQAFDRFVLRRDPARDLDVPADVAPAELAAAIVDPGQRTHVVQFLIVMALVDGVVDPARIAVTLGYARALAVADDAVHQFAELGRGNLAWVRADVARQNLRSITGHDVDESIDQWIVPYRDRPDPGLVQRYEALGRLPVGTLGRTFFEFYRANGFPFAGDPRAVNARFGNPHDSSHVLSGYDTSPQGELLVSTFTAGMHPQEPMSGHILPVIISWHLGIELAKFAGEIKGQLDPEKFWVAWERGAEVTTDVFADDWDLFAVAARPLDELRATYGVPPLDPAHAAHGDIPAWYHPVA